VQQILNKIGFTVASKGAGSKGRETNVLGPATKRALIKYQSSKGLVPTGVLDQKTIDMLLKEKESIVNVCTSSITLSGPVRLGWKNNRNDVLTIERFLNTYENAKLPENGIYERRDYNAVIRWQNKYAKDVLAPAGLNKATGHVHTLSLNKMREIDSAQCR
jgi:hypothetical protein